MSGREPAWSGPLRWTWLHTAAAAWTVAGLGFWLLNAWLWDEIWIMTIALFGAYALAGAVVFFVCLAAGFRRGWTRGRVTAGAMLLGGAMLVGQSGPALTAMGGRWTFDARFRRMEPRYEQIVRDLAARPGAWENGTWRGVQFVVDSGPPLRVAFPQPGSIIDNWEGVVYDPTGSLAAAVSHDERGRWRPPPRRFVRLFGGELTGCEPVRGPYFRCWFT
jgi:hypothetical protein